MARPIDSIELTHPSTAPALTRDSSFASLASKLDADESRSPSITALPALAQLAGPTGRSSPAEEEPAQRMRRLSMGEELDGEGRVLPPVDRGKDAWLFVAAGFILETFIWGFGFAFPSVLVYLQTHDPWQRSSLAALSAVGTTLLAVQFMLPIVVITIFRRYPEWVRTILWASVALNCGSMLAASWATQVSHLIILVGVLGGISGAILYAPVILWLNEWWHARRGMASGIVFAGTGIGGLVFPFLLSALLNRGGFPLMARVWAGVTAAVYLPAVWYLRPRVPPRRPARGGRAPWLAVDWGYLKDPVVMAMTFTSFTSSLATFPVSLFLPTYTLALSTSRNSDLVVSIYNLSGSLGSTATGWLSDVSLPATVLIMGVAGGLLALTAWGFAANLGAVFAFGVLFAFFTQVCSAWGAAARDSTASDPHTATLVFCTFGITRGIASIVGPFISTTLYDPNAEARGGDAASDPTWGRYGFERVIIFVGCMSFASALGGFGLWWAKREKRRREEEKRAGVAGR
ncbi:hypothetical protein JCM6882_009408 [Rhodosporidiobolus microsporus]